MQIARSWGEVKQDRPEDRLKINKARCDDAAGYEGRERSRDWAWIDWCNLLL